MYKGLRWQTQNILNVVYDYVPGRFGLAAPIKKFGSFDLPSKFLLDLETKPFSGSFLVRLVYLLLFVNMI